MVLSSISGFIFILITMGLSAKGKVREKLRDFPYPNTLY